MKKYHYLIVKKRIKHLFFRIVITSMSPNKDLYFFNYMPNFPLFVLILLSNQIDFNQSYMRILLYIFSLIFLLTFSVPLTLSISWSFFKAGVCEWMGTDFLILRSTWLGPIWAKDRVTEKNMYVYIYCVSVAVGMEWALSLYAVVWWRFNSCL